jgi:NADH-quinone oxidoreductase subunit G
MPKITLNGKAVEFEPGKTIIEVAFGSHENVPHYCWHPALPVVASCRICQVEMAAPGPNGLGPKRLVTACNTHCADGMVVETETPAVAKARAGNLEGLLLNHPLDCPICDKAGECWLQDYTYEYGAAVGRQDFPRRKAEKRKDISEHVLLDQERCILCTRCVRFLDHYAKQPELVVTARGEQSVIDIFPGQPVSSDYQGNLADICPVGALTLKEFRFKNRVWYLKGHDSVCPACSRGCSITLDVRDNELNRVRPRTNPQVNGWFICDVGRFDLSRRYHPETRVTEMHVRGEGADLETAAEAIAAALEAAGRDGGKTLVLASVEATNEEAFLLKRALRGQPNVTFGFREVKDVGGDGILRTGQPAANVRGLEVQGYRALAPEALARAAMDAAVVIAFDDGLPALDRVVGGTIVVIGIQSHLFPLATVQIPGNTFGEKDGTVTNFEGVTQRVRPGLKAPSGVPGDHATILAIGAALGVDLPATASDAFLTWTDAIGPGNLTLAALSSDGEKLATKAETNS